MLKIFKSLSKKSYFVPIAILIVLFVFRGAGVLFADTPTVVTGSASSVTKTTALFSGNVTNNGGNQVTATGYEYGLTTSYGTDVSVSTSYGYVSKFGSAGSGDGQFNGAYDVALDSFGNIFVTDFNNHRVQKFDSSGTYVSQFGSFGSGDGQFNLPTGIVIDSSDNIYVADYDNNRVQKFDSSGTFLSQLGTTSTGFTSDAEGDFFRPGGLAIDPSNNLYVLDSYNERVQKFDSSGNFLFTFGWGVDSGASAFEICTSGCQSGTIGLGDGQFDHPFGIDLDSNGNIYVADTNADLADSNGHRIQKFDSDGNFVTKTGTFGSGNGQFNRPFGITVDDDDNIFVSDTYNNRIQKLDSSLGYVSQFGSGGSGNGSFNLPWRMIFDSSGNVYVTEFGGNRVQKFGLTLASGQATGLSCDTTYHFRAYATNAEGTSYGSDETFTTLSCQVPGVETLDASGITDESATLVGLYVNMPVKPGLTRGFEYGPTTSYGTTVSENGNEYISQFGSGGTENGEFDLPTGVALDSSGNIYVVDSNNSRVQKFDSSGAWLLNITGNGGDFLTPTGVYVDVNDHVYISDAGNGRVQKFDSSGAFQLEIGTGTLTATTNAFDNIAVDSSGRIYIPDHSTGAVFRFDSGGNYLDNFADGWHCTPYSVAIDSSDNVYVADDCSGIVQIFNSSGTPTIAIGSGSDGALFTVSIDEEENVYITSPDNNNVSKYDSSGTLLYTFGSLGVGDGGLNVPSATTVDANGDILVADTFNNRVQKFGLQFSLEVSSLTCGTTYHFRAFATNDDGVGYGEDETLTPTCDFYGEYNPGTAPVFLSGFQGPHAYIKDNKKQTNFRMVDLVVLSPISVTRYEISNSLDFKNKKSFKRETLEKHMSWDLCEGSHVCSFGLKNIYVRFYFVDKLIAERTLEIAYLPEKECPYFKGYLKMGSRKNNPEEVSKMQSFLNARMGENLAVDGYFGKSTHEAVKRFQSKYKDQIIKPWPALNHATGWWYITTSAYANVLVGC